MKRYVILYLMLISALMVSCSDHDPGAARPHPLVEAIVADTTSSYNHAVRAAGHDNNHGTIAVVGAPSDVVLVSEALLTSDMHDNISGSHNPDGLPDFSGEVIAQILDIAHPSYEVYASENGEDALRELSVRNFLRAVDTTVVENPLDGSSVRPKRRAKMVVFASSLSSAFGLFDVDTLCSSLGSGVIAVAPVQAMVDYARSRHHGPLSFVVWSENSRITRGIYSSSMKDEEYVALAPSMEYVSTASSIDAEDSVSVRTSFLRLLDMYMDAGNSRRISAVLVDNFDIPTGSVDQTVEEILSSDDDDLLIYRNILEPDFECIYPGPAIADRCYRHLRMANAFTHRIAYPELRSFLTSDSTEFLVEMRERYLSPELMEFIQVHAPKTYSLYVR